jgi:hypothetical protein
MRRRERLPPGQPQSVEQKEAVLCPKTTWQDAWNLQEHNSGECRDQDGPTARRKRR